MVVNVGNCGAGEMTPDLDDLAGQSDWGKNRDICGSQHTLLLIGPQRKFWRSFELQIRTISFTIPKFPLKVMLEPPQFKIGR